jgi:predicted DNA-binding transcriptional regulator AlpA
MEKSISRSVYRMKHLPGRTGMGPSLIYREIKEGNFPEGQWVTPNVRIWTEEVIAAEMQRRFNLYNNANSGA